MTDLHRILTAGDIMTRRLITLRPDMSIFEAIRVLLKNSISGAPVVGPSGDSFPSRVCRWSYSSRK